VARKRSAVRSRLAPPYIALPATFQAIFLTDYINIFLMRRKFLYSQIGLGKGVNEGEVPKMWTECGQIRRRTFRLLES
jgi:hypothetical protein